MKKNNKDVDNMVKYYMDAMHQVAYQNDLQIYKVIAIKNIVAVNPRTHIKLIVRE